MQTDAHASPRVKPIALAWCVLAAILAVIAVGALAVLQRIPNGSSDYFAIDSGETQVVLNVGGTLHATGYPHYALAGTALTGGLRLLGVDAAAAPAMSSLVFGLAALGGLAVLVSRLLAAGAAARAVRASAWVAALAAVFVYAFTRTVWVHLAIAEIYSFTLLVLVGLYALALAPGGLSPTARMVGLAVLGGAAVAHHRAFIVVIPALVFAMGPQVAVLVRRPLHLLGVLALGLLGFLPYLYLPLRAAAGAPWVYGQPGTGPGFWEQFWGTEAARFIGLPGQPEAVLANIALVVRVVATDLTTPGVLIGVVGLAWGVRNPATRRSALTFALAGAGAAVFHMLFYTDVLSALILIVTCSIAAGWALAVFAFLTTPVGSRALPFVRRGGLGMVGAAATLAAAGFAIENGPFIAALTGDRAGLDAIALARTAPPGSTLMLPWGMAHHAVGFARDVQADPALGAIALVDHNAHLREPAETGVLVVPAYLRYTFDKAWWEARIGSPLFAHAAAFGLVRITTAPEPAQAAGAALTADARVSCTAAVCDVAVTWALPADAEPLTRDWSVFVHLIDEAGAVLAQGDQRAPVYGWRPTTGWQPGEQVRDLYRIVCPPGVPAGQPTARFGAPTVRFGLYAQEADGRFTEGFSQQIRGEVCPSEQAFSGAAAQVH
jgi:hypothetical protein